MTLTATPAATAAPTSAPSIGPTLSVGVASIVGGDVRVPVYASGSGFAAYSGFQLYLRWNPSIFSFVRADTTGGLFPPGTTTSICFLGPADDDRGGALVSCGNPGGRGAHDTGLIVNLILRPIDSGCSVLHLVRYTEAYGAFIGSFTSAADAAQSPQSNEYVDGAADNRGNACEGGSLTSPSPRSTASAIAPTRAPRPSLPATGDGPQRANAPLAPIVSLLIFAAAVGAIVFRWGRTRT